MQTLRVVLCLSLFVSCSVAFSPPIVSRHKTRVLPTFSSPKTPICDPSSQTRFRLRHQHAKDSALRFPPLFCANQDGQRLPKDGDSQPESAAAAVRRWPIVRSVVAFGKWLVASFRSLLVMRLSWLLHATARIKDSLLDHKRPLVSCTHAELNTLWCLFGANACPTWNLCSFVSSCFWFYIPHP